MRITRLALTGYKRLLLRNLNYFEIKPKSVYQLILGTNGSGKSSVLKELTPLPAYSGDYIKGGSKIIELEHRGKSYCLTSDFTVGNKHSFMVNGEELNPGGTVTIQKDLVFQHFGFSESLHEVLNGLERFTSMSPMRRREMTILLSGADLGFAMEVYNKMKSKARDMVGVVKHLTQRLTNESSKLPSKDKLDEYFRTIDLLKSELALMMESKDPSIKENEQRIADRIKTNLSRVEELSIAIIEADLSRPAALVSATLNNMADLTEEVNRSKSQVLSNEQMHTHYLNEYQKIAEIVEALEKSNAEGLDDLAKRIETLKNERKALLATLHAFEQQINPQSLLAAFNAVFDDLTDIFSQLPSNETGFYTREKRDFYKDQFDKAAVEREQNIVERVKLNERLTHLQNAKKENCPKCGYIYIAGSTENETERINALIDKVEAIEKTIITRSEEAKNYLEAFSQYADLRKRIARIIESNPALKALWDSIYECLTKNPRQALIIMNQYRDDLFTSIKLDELDANIKTFELAYIKASEMDGDGHYHEAIQSLNDKIEETVSSKSVLAKELKLLQNYQNLLIEVIEYSQGILVAQRTIESDLIAISKAIRNDLLQKCINEHLSKLSYNEQLLISAKAVKDVVSDLETSLKEARESAEVYRILTDELSPTDGLIAEQLKGFIGCLVEQMNAIINQIWTYSLEVMPCGVDSDELDYKFPVSVNCHELIVPDISKTSSAQIDIIDFAFRLVVMLYLELDDFPIYLDELAPSFDDQHRINLMNFINQLVETKKCSQLYMISHYAASHGSLLNADICLMDERNILSKPREYNVNVTMR